MTSNINWNCDFCEAKLNEEPFYRPINSRRGVIVTQCPSCCLVQSQYTKSYASRPPGNMSSDADRSSFRYTKTLVADTYTKIIEAHIPTNIKRIIDIGSNRGVFVSYAKTRFPNASFFCIETDETIVDYFSDDSVVGVVGRFEDIEIPEAEFDFAYSVHTFEHLRSAKIGFKKAFSSLKLGGLFFLAVPNLILHDDVIEEYFIDPHTFHFTHSTLTQMALDAGFNVIEKSPKGSPDVILLLEKPKDGRRKIPVGVNFKKSEVFNFSSYQCQLSQNRVTIRRHSSKLLQETANRDVVIWGGGRIFDAMVKFGDLKECDNLFVYDKFLSSITESQNGFKLISKLRLEEIAQNDAIVYVASRDYRNEIIAEATSIGFSSFLVFGDENV